MPQDYTPDGRIQREGDWGLGAGDQRPQSVPSPYRGEERDERVASMRIDVLNTNAPEIYATRIAGIAVDRNFTLGTARGARESEEVDGAQATMIALAADFLANMNPAETVRYAALHGMPVFTTDQRNAVRFEAAQEAVGIFLRENHPRMPAQDTMEIVQAALPIARDMVRERQ